MEKDKIRTSRASQTRTKAEAKKVWTPPNSLDAPPAPKAFDISGLELKAWGIKIPKMLQHL